MRQGKSLKYSRAEVGATIVEYGVLLSLLALIIIVSVRAVGNQVDTQVRAYNTQTGSSSTTGATSSGSTTSSGKAPSNPAGITGAGGFRSGGLG